MSFGDLRIIPVRELGLIQAGDDLPALVLDRLCRQGVAVDDGDVLVITSKVLSKAEGRIVPLDTVVPHRRARALGKVAGRDPRICELILRHSKKVWGILPTGRTGLAWSRKFPDAFPVGPEVVERLFAKEPNMILAEVYDGLLLTDAGIDCSNVHGTENAILLPESADASCRRIRAAVRERTGRTIAVIANDTEIRFQRFGSIDQAIGSWGIPTVASHFGKPDLFGKPKIGGIEAITDMVASAASLVIGNNAQAIPAALVKGVRYEPVESGLAPIQVHLNSVAEGVAYNVWCDMRLWYYNRADV